MSDCSLQPIIVAVAAMIVAVTPGVVALVMSLSQQRAIDRLPRRRTDTPSPPDARTGTGGTGQ